MAVEVTEGAAEDTVVATISCVGGTAPFTFTVASQERANWFKIVGDELQVGSGTIDYETDASPTVTIQVEDDHGYMFSKAFTIPVVNVTTDDDVTPNAFTFTDVSNAALSTLYTSNTITVAGLGSTASVAVTVSGGTYSKNGGGYTSSAGTAVNGDTFAVRVTSSGSLATAVNATLTIGGVSDTYTVTTAASGAPTTGAHRYWRINITSNTGFSSSVLELEFWRDPNTKHTNVTTISSGTTGGTDTNVFDGVIDGNFWAGTWVGQDFGAGNAKEVGMIAIIARYQAGQAPNTFTIDYSDNGSSWTTAWTMTSVGSYLASRSAMSYFTEPAAGFKHYRVRNAADASGAFRVAEIELRTVVSGSDISQNASIYYSSGNSVGTAASAFDNNTSTDWSHSAGGAWVAALFDYAPVIAEFTITGTANGALVGQGPDDVKLDYSTDGFAWTNVHDTAGPLTWTAGETKTFTV